MGRRTHATPAQRLGGGLHVAAPITTFPAPRERFYSASNPPYLLTERYGFEVGNKSFALQFQPVTHRDGYDPRQLAALRKTATCEVSFRLENCVLPDGTLLSGYDTLGTGNPFKVLGGVANGIVDWARARRPDFSYWRADGAGRQRLYDQMIDNFAARGSG